MRLWMAIGAISVLSAAGSSGAAPSLDIRDAAAVVTIIPEPRADIEVSIARTNARLPLKVTHDGGQTTIDGGLRFHSMDCHRGPGGGRVAVAGVGDFAHSELPALIVRTPMEARVGAAGAVFGAIGRTASLDFANGGCGDWVVANVAGAMTLRAAGSGDVRAANAGSADIRIAGSSDVFTQAVAGGLSVVGAGSGDLRAASVGGAFTVRIVGSGDVTAPAGNVTDMKVMIAGSGNVRFGGVARSLEATVAGSGDVTVRGVTGPVTRRVAGSGEVRIGG